MNLDILEGRRIGKIKKNELDKKEMHTIFFNDRDYKYINIHTNFDCFMCINKHI